MVNVETVILLVALGIIFVLILRKICHEIKYRNVYKQDIKDNGDWSAIPAEIFEKLYHDVIAEAKRWEIKSTEEPKIKSRWSAMTDFELMIASLEVIHEVEERGLDKKFGRKSESDL